MPPATNSKIKFKPLRLSFDGDDLPNKNELINAALNNRVDPKYYDELIGLANLNLVKAKDESKALLNVSVVTARTVFQIKVWIPILNHSTVKEWNGQ